MFLQPWWFACHRKIKIFRRYYIPKWQIRMRTVLLTRASNWNNKILTTRDVLNFYSRDDSFVFEKSKFSENTTPLSDKNFYFLPFTSSENLDVFGVMFWENVMFLAWCFGKKRDVFSVMFWKKRDVFRMIFWRKIDILVWCFEKKKIFLTHFLKEYVKV